MKMRCSIELPPNNTELFTEIRRAERAADRINGMQIVSINVSHCVQFHPSVFESTSKCRSTKVQWKKREMEKKQKQRAHVLANANHENATRQVYGH